jgi:hypothetical protein
LGVASNVACLPEVAEEVVVESEVLEEVVAFGVVRIGGGDLVAPVETGKIDPRQVELKKRPGEAS